MSESLEPNSNSRLKNLPEERMAQIYEWATKPNELDGNGKAIPLTGGLAFARSQLAADGLVVSLDTVSEFRRWYGARLRMRSAMAASEQQRELMAKFKPGDATLAREFAEFTLLQKANELEDPELFTAVTMAQDMRRSGDHKEKELAAKIKGFEAKFAQKERELLLAEKKYQRDTCKQFIAWFSDEQAKQIVTGGGTNAEKIEALGRAMFGEDWDKE